MLQVTSKTRCPAVATCLPDRAVSLHINNALTRAGFAVTCASDFGELEQALSFGPFCAVVTITSLAMAIRSLTDMPVVVIDDHDDLPADTLVAGPPVHSLEQALIGRLFARLQLGSPASAACLS